MNDATDDAAKTEKAEGGDRAYHHGDLRASLVEAASKLLEEVGANGLSLRHVAREAGVSHAAPYRHFRDKHALLEAVAAAGFRTLERRIQEMEARHPENPRRQLLASCRAYVQEVLKRPERAHLMFGGFLDPSRRSQELDTAIRQSFGTMVATVQRGEGTLYRDLPTRDLVLALWSATHGLALLTSADQLSDLDPEGDPEARLERMLSQLIEGLGRRTADPSTGPAT